MLHGRTDAGVHALGQVANFSIENTIPLEKIPLALNSRLKKSIRIINAEEVGKDFHSRYHCKRKLINIVLITANMEQRFTVI